eukprot:341482-Chlamydomonas_euryale.AAC.1
MLMSWALIATPLPPHLRWARGCEVSHHEARIVVPDVDDKHVVLTRVLERLIHAQHRAQRAALQEDHAELLWHGQGHLWHDRGPGVARRALLESCPTLKSCHTPGPGPLGPKPQT